MEQQVIDIIQDALKTVIIVSAPLVGIAIIVGLVISIFQATTQIQEQTLSFGLKIVAVLVSLAFFGSWMIKVLVEFTNRIYAYLGAVIQ